MASSVTCPGLAHGSPDIGLVLPDAIGSTEPTTAPGDDLRSLLRIPMTWAVVAWWTFAYGSLSWLIEWWTSGFDRTADRMPFMHGLNRMVYATVWAVAIIVVIGITELVPVTRRWQPGRIALHIVACLVMTVVWAAVAYYACLLVVPGWKPMGVGHMLSSTSKDVLFGYCLVTVMVHVVWRVRRYRAREFAMLRRSRLATEAQLHALKMELQPHFLFNALHSISALIDTDPAAANETLVRLSDMLRYTMETSRIQEVSLREELASLQLYTEIEQVRFGDRLALTWEVDADTLDAVVPHMLLQPLVENAIKHGPEVYAVPGRITIASARDGAMLHLVIRDNGPGLRTVSPLRGAGIGLSNTRARLRELYGDSHAFLLTDHPSGGTEVSIRIPFVRASVRVSLTR